MKCYFKIFLVLALSTAIGCSGGVDSSEVEDRILSLQMFTADGDKTDKITLAASGHLLAELTNTFGKPIPNEIISFKTSLGTIQPATAKTVTDSEGKASVILIAGQESGAGEVQAIFGEHIASFRFTVESLPGLNLSLKLIGSTGEETRAISTALPGKLEAVLSYGNKIPIPNQTLQFTTSLGYIQPTSGTAITDNNGKAGVDLLAGLESGDGKASVSFGKYSIETKFTVTSQEIYVTLDLFESTSGICPPAGLPATWNKIYTLNACSPQCLMATAKHLSGNPLANSVVHFKTDLGGILPVKGTNPENIQPGDVQSLEATALTDENGRAAVYLFAGNKAGAGKAAATVETYPSAQFGFTTLGDQNIFLKLRLFDIPQDDSEPQEIREISASSPGNLTAYLMSGCNEEPIADQMISFSTTLGAIDPATATAKTDAQGKASVTLLAGSEAGAGQAAAAYGELKTDPLAFSTLGDGKITLSLRLIDANGVAISDIGSSQSGILEAILLDANQQPYVNQVVSFAVSDPKLAHIEPQKASALTDTTGKATVNLLAGSKNGAGTVTATFGDIASTVNFRCNGSGSDPMVLSLKVQDDTGKEMSKIPAGTPARLVATLTSADGTPVSGTTVSFTTTFGTIQPKSQEITNDKGQAAVFIDSKSIGYGTATAKAEGYSATFNFSFVEPEESKNPILSLQLVSNTTGYGLTDNTISASESGRVIATLTDENGKPLTGKLITFTASKGLIESAATTDSSGRVSVLLQAGSDSGLGKVTAKFGNTSSELSFYIK